MAAAITAEYVNDDGTMTSDAQTAYALGLRFDVTTDPAMRDAAAARLAQLVRDAGNRIATGFVGTPPVSDAAAETPGSGVHTRTAALSS